LTSRPLRPPGAAGTEPNATARRRLVSFVVSFSKAATELTGRDGEAAAA
jgi:hypothetical protein